MYHHVVGQDWVLRQVHCKGRRSDRLQFAGITYRLRTCSLVVALPGKLAELAYRPSRELLFFDGYCSAREGSSIHPLTQPTSAMRESCKSAFRGR
jgi:hypothetical protein